MLTCCSLPVFATYLEVKKEVMCSGKGKHKTNKASKKLASQLQELLNEDRAQEL